MKGNSVILSETAAPSKPAQAMRASSASVGLLQLGDCADSDIAFDIVGCPATAPHLQVTEELLAQVHGRADLLQRQAGRQTFRPECPAGFHTVDRAPAAEATLTHFLRAKLWGLGQFHFVTLFSVIHLPTNSTANNLHLPATSRR